MLPGSASQCPDPEERSCADRPSGVRRVKEVSVVGGWALGQTQESVLCPKTNCYLALANGCHLEM